MGWIPPEFVTKAWVKETWICTTTPSLSNMIFQFFLREIALY
jgi:hypothetical protein